MGLILVYLAAIVIANLSVAAFGPAVSIVNAFLFIALDLSSRDTLHERWQGHGLVWRMAALIAAGSVLSYLLNANSAGIALASFVAFAAASIGDTVVYTLLHRWAYLVKSNGSNVVSAALDSTIFPILAFGVPILWGIILGQFVAKMVGGFLWSLILSKRYTIETPTIVYERAIDD